MRDPRRPPLGRGLTLSAVRGGQQEVGITGQPFTGENIVDASGHTWERGGLAELRTLPNLVRSGPGLRRRLAVDSPLRDEQQAGSLLYPRAMPRDIAGLLLRAMAARGADGAPSELMF